MECVVVLVYLWSPPIYDDQGATCVIRKLIVIIMNVGTGTEHKFLNIGLYPEVINILLLCMLVLHIPLTYALISNSAVVSISADLWIV